MEMKITRQAIGHSVKNTEFNARSYIVKNLLIPLGAGGLAALLFRKEEVSYQTDERPSWLIFLQKMMDVINERFDTQPAEEDPVTENQEPAA